MTADLDIYRAPKLKKAKAEFDRLLKQAIDHPERTNRRQFWAAMKRVTVAKKVVARLGAE